MANSKSTLREAEAWNMGYEHSAELVEQLPGLSQADKQAILGGNAQSLFKLNL